MRADEADPEDVAQLQQEIVSLLDREKRLVRLYTFGEIDEALLKEEGANLRRQRDLLQDRLRITTARMELVMGHIDRHLPSRVCSRG